MELASTRFTKGVIEFERVAQQTTPQLAYIAEIERWQAKVAGSDEVSSGELRVTSILRPEDGTWKVIHRHADPITTARPPSSAIPG